MQVFIFLHILTVFVAFALGFGGIVMVRVAARSDKPQALPGTMIVAERLSSVTGPAWILGILLGLVAMFTNGFNPFAPWLLIAYVLVLAAVVSANVVLQPLFKRIGEALNGPEGSVDRARAIVNASRTQTLLTLDAVIIVAIIADMVLKPFS
jgi:hypothetical protein